MIKHKRFGEILIEAGVVTEMTLRLALDKQKGSGKRLGQVLEEMGVVTGKDTAIALARQFGFRTVQNLANFNFPNQVLSLFDSELLLRKNIFPLKVDQKTLYLAMVNPLDMTTIDDIAFKTRLRIVPCVTTAGEIQDAIQRHYPEVGLQGATEPSPDWWTILMVEDQDLVRSSVVNSLKKEGYKTLEATNGAEGLKVTYQYRPHLIIADTLMPRMDGHEMFRALQATPQVSKIPVIALSSKSTAEEEARLLDDGYFDFVAKPINSIRLMARVRKALRSVYEFTDPPLKQQKNMENR